MKKLSLTPETLRVDSFPTEAPGAFRPGTVRGHVTTRPYTCPECANTSPYATCDFRAEEVMPPADRRGTVQGHAIGWPVTRPECANTVYDTCDTCNVC